MKKTLLTILFSTSLLSQTSLANQLMLLGESDHRNSVYREKTKKFISQNLRNYNTLALEAFETDKQYILDNYNSSPTQNNLDKISNYLNIRWKGYNPESYTNLIKYAKQKNLTIIGIDEPKHLQPKETELNPVPPHISKKRKSREKHMAKTLCKLPFYSNTIVLIGKTHTNLNYLPNQIKITCDIESKIKLL
jgi:uncharacterized iron-regulated protein